MHCDRCVHRLRAVTDEDAPAHLNPGFRRCSGRGQSIKTVCPACKGQRIVHSDAELTLHIDRGMPENAEILFEGEGDETPDYEAGDIIVRVKSKRDPGGFLRKDSNLYWKEPISVAEVRSFRWSLRTRSSDSS